MKDNKKRKLIDLSEKCVKILSKEAINNNTDFKNHAQNILEDAAKKLTKNIK